MDKGCCTSFPQFVFPKKDTQPPPHAHRQLRGPQEEPFCRGWGGWDDCLEFHTVGHVGGLQGGWAGKKCICGQLFWREEKAEGHRGWGEVPKPGAGGRGAGAECRLSLQRNIPSRNSSHPPPFHPSSIPHSCPLGGLESRQFFMPKRPRDITSTAMATNYEVMGSTAYEEGKGAGG